MTASEPDLLAALRPVLDALRRLGVPHYVGGSIASSAHGVPRASIDADVVADLRPTHAAGLIEALRPGYYVPEQRVAEAILRRGSFNVIHLDTMVKIDIFLPRDRAQDRLRFDRVQLAPVAGGAIPVSSPEDTILAKIEWFRQGGEVSERQWTDITGLLRVAADIDRRYLAASARGLGLDELLGRALAEAGAGDEPS